MLIDFDGQKILVTGGSRGIGKKIALAFLENGDCQVVITGQSKDAPDWVDGLVKQGVSLNYYSLDFARNDWVKPLEEIIAKHDGFDVCVNNAGINSIHHLPDFPVEKIDEILSVNLQAPIVISGLVSKIMAQKKYGKIVNISSIFGVVSKAKRSAYTASKSGLIGVTRTMALDLAKDNILVNSISPGFFDTELTRNVLGEAGMNEMAFRIPMQRLGRPEEIATYVLFVASKQNTYMTGENIVIDGGFICE